MKKNRLIVFIMALVLGVFFVIPVSVFASNPADKYADDWYNHISGVDYGVARCVPMSPHSFELYGQEIFFLLIAEEPSSEFVFSYIEYGRDDLNYFEPLLRYVLQDWLDYDFYYEDFATQVEMVAGSEANFDGFLYWNYEERWWQFEYYDSPSPDYYLQIIEDLRNEISNLEDEILSLEDELYYVWRVVDEKHSEIVALEAEIQDLLDQVQGMRDALDSEFSRGYNAAVDEVNALEKVIPSAFGSVWLVISDFLSIEILGIAIWEVIGALVAVGLAIIIIRMFL